MLQAHIYIDKEEMKGEKPLYQFILEFLLKNGIVGATAFRGVMGFGRNHHLKNPDRLFSFDEPPMLIIFIDEKDKVRNVLKELKKENSTGFTIVSEVEKI